MRFRLYHLFLLLLPFLLGSCRDVVSDRPIITVSIEPLRYFVQSIGGDKFQVNTLGSATNYGIGRLGREDMIERYLRVNPQALERGKRYVHRFGYWGGLLSWIPILGSLITIALGYLRVNLPLTLLMLTLGKFLRYCLVIIATEGVQSLL